jgi:Helix-turn-helix domain
MSRTVTHQEPKRGRQERQCARANQRSHPPSRLGVILTDRRRTRTPAGPETPGESTSNLEDLQALGATTDVVTTGKFLGISRNTAYRLARRGAFPLPVVRVGVQYRVPTAALIAALHPPPSGPAATSSEAP